MSKVDPVASLRVWAVEVDVAGRTLRVPPLPAADWLPVLMSLDPLNVLDIADDVGIEGALLDGTLSYDALRGALESLVEMAAGRRCETALVLAGIASEHWAVVGGELARRGIRFADIPLGAALDAVYSVLCALTDEKGVAALNRALDGAVATGAPRSRVPAPRPVPASAEQYVRVRPKTRLRRPQDHPADPNASPTPPPAPPAGSARHPTPGPRPAGRRPPG